MAQSSIPGKWKQLREDFEEDLRRTRYAKFTHAIQIRQGISTEEDEDEWRWLLQHATGEKERVLWRNWVPRRGAKQGVQHCFLGEVDKVTIDLMWDAGDLVRRDPDLSAFRTDNFLLLLYLVAWERPQDVSYCIAQFAFTPGDKPRRISVFNTLHDFERWESGQLDIPDGRYFLWLNRDVRKCAISTIDALFDTAECAIPGVEARADEDGRSAADSTHEEDPHAIYIGNGIVKVPGRENAVQFSGKLKDVLVYLVERRVAPSKDLQKVCSNPSEYVKDLRTRYDGALEAYIVAPGQRGVGKGYSTNIVDGRKEAADAGEAEDGGSAAKGN